MCGLRLQPNLAYFWHGVHKSIRLSGSRNILFSYPPLFLNLFQLDFSRSFYQICEPIHIPSSASCSTRLPNDICDNVMDACKRDTTLCGQSRAKGVCSAVGDRWLVHRLVYFVRLDSPLTEALQIGETNCHFDLFEVLGVHMHGWSPWKLVGAGVVKLVGDNESTYIRSIINSYGSELQFVIHILKRARDPAFVSCNVAMASLPCTDDGLDSDTSDTSTHLYIYECWEAIFFFYHSLLILRRSVSSKQ